MCLPVRACACPCVSVSPLTCRCCRSRAPHAPHAPSAVYIVPDRSSSEQTHPVARLKRDAVPKVGDVIDLGAPRLHKRERRRKTSGPVYSYTPNPRLYPGPQAKTKPRLKRTEPRGNEGRGRRRKRVFRRPVPNARLYRPAPPRPPPPPAWPPRASWPQPPPPAYLDTASRVALRLSEQRRGEQRRLLWTGAPRPLVPRAGHSLVLPEHSTLWTQRAPLRAVRSPVKAARSPVKAARSPVKAVRSPVRAAQSPVEAARLPVKAAWSPVQLSRVPPPTAHAPSPSRRLVVTLPAPYAEPPQHYWPASEHFRLRSLDTDSGATTPAAQLGTARAPPYAAAGLAMDAANRHSTSPEDCSEGNETLSAPSEFLAEFLSAIMRRQYAEALKYCRLILQYEPHNATARGFYPLLQHKVQAHKRAEEGGWARSSSSEEASAHADKPQPAPAPDAQEMMEQGADDLEGESRASRSSSHSRGSCASQSSLELDSSDTPAHSSLSVSLSASAGAWDSTGSASRSEPDDNGNAPAPLAPAAPSSRASDLHNDNEAAAPYKSESAASSLRRLRAQFTCSIK